MLVEAAVSIRHQGTWVADVNLDFPRQPDVHRLSLDDLEYTLKPAASHEAYSSYRDVGPSSRLFRGRVSDDVT